MSEDDIRATLLNKGFEYKSIIGKGGYSSCHLVYSKKYNQNFVCKVLSLLDNKDLIRKKSFENEIHALCQIINSYIIRVYDSFSSDSHLFLILEYCPFGDMNDYIINNGPIKDPYKLLSYLQKILDALVYLEERGIAHKDIKPANIFIDINGRPKLADFGLANTYQKDEFSNDYTGTLAFLAPEIISRIPYKPLESDVWSFGVTTYFLATGSYPFSLSNKNCLISAILAGTFPIPEYVNPFVRKLLYKTIVLNPEKRPTFAQIKEAVDNELMNYNVNVSPQSLKRRRRNASCDRFSKLILSKSSVFTRSRPYIITPSLPSSPPINSPIAVGK